MTARLFVLSTAALLGASALLAAVLSACDGDDPAREPAATHEVDIRSAPPMA